MERDALLQRSREELADLVLALAGRVAELEAAVARLGGRPKTPGNSSVPPSAGLKPNRAERRRRGRGPKHGHLGISRRRQRPDTIVRCRPRTCQGCGTLLPLEGQRRVGRSRVINADGAGTRVGGQAHWHWVFQTPDTSYHTIAPSRRTRVIEAFLAGAVPVVWGSGMLLARMKAAAERHQVCLAHQIRDLVGAVEADDLTGRVWACAALDIAERVLAELRLGMYT